MQSFSAHDAKAHFGKLLDTARREPVTIEKHGRAVAVVISKEEFDDIEAMKLERLRSEVQKGIDASSAGDVVEVADRELEQFVERIMTGGTERAAR
jgi:prevent-host-death family protein